MRKKEPMRKRKKIKKSCSNPDITAELPQEVITDILFLLPVKTLVRFRCVCKSWLVLFSNPDFIKTHLQKSHLLNNYTNHRLIISHIGSFGLNVYSCILHSCSLDFSTNINIDVALLDYPKRRDIRHIKIVDSCNGLVCIRFISDGIYLWNPCTKQSKRLPVSGLENLRASYGFGYDQTNDDYKVVLMICHRFKREVKVYSLNTNSWRKIGDFPLCAPRPEQGIYVNRVLHWKVELSSGSNSSIVIVTLDLGKYVYGEIVTHCLCDSDSVQSSLGVLEGCLSVFYSYYEPSGRQCLEIWVMKEYGVMGSWTKLYTIPYATKPGGNRYYYPLCITVTGEILFRSGWRLSLYNPTSGRLFCNPKIGNLSSYLMDLNSIAYVESLVSNNLMKMCRVHTASPRLSHKPYHPAELEVEQTDSVMCVYISYVCIS